MYLLPWRGSCDTTDTRTKDQAKITWLTVTIDRKYSTTSLQQYVQKMNLPLFKSHSQHISWLSLRKLGWAKARLPLQPGCVVCWAKSHDCLYNPAGLSKITWLPLQPGSGLTTWTCWAKSHDCLYNLDVLGKVTCLPLQPKCVEQHHMTAFTTQMFWAVTRLCLYNPAVLSKVTWLPLHFTQHCQIYSPAVLSKITWFHLLDMLIKSRPQAHTLQKYPCTEREKV